MAKTIAIGEKYTVTAGTLKGFVGRCFAADMNSDSLHGIHALLEIDDLTSVFIHPKYLEIVRTPDELDVRQILMGCGNEP